MIVLALAENSIQLVPDGTLLLHLLLVIGMVAVLNRTLFRPINKVLEKRELETGGRLSQAQKTQENFEKSLLQYERGLREARSAAYQMIETERGEALRQREERIARTKEEIRFWVGEERAEIERQAEEARKSLTAESSESAVGIGSRILHRTINSRSDS
jgi:F0F1-type ATP synthase membrane subunit b/b'